MEVKLEQVLISKVEELGAADNEQGYPTEKVAVLRQDQVDLHAAET